MPRSPQTLDLPSGPPPEVLAEIDAAWERAQELSDDGLDLHFELDAASGLVAAALRTASGATLERMSGRHALLVCCGDALTRPLVAAA